MRNHDMRGFIAASRAPALTALVAWVGASIVCARLLSARLGYDDAGGEGCDTVGALTGERAAAVGRAINAMVDRAIAARAPALAATAASAEKAKVRSPGGAQL